MIVAVDFDMTLAITDFPAILHANQPVVEYCKQRKVAGDVLILWTCRHGEVLDAAVEWCREQGLVFDYVNENMPELNVQYGWTRKVYADIYIDDRNVLIEQILKGKADGARLDRQ